MGIGGHALPTLNKAQVEKSSAANAVHATAMAATAVNAVNVAPAMATVPKPLLHPPCWTST